MTTSRDDLNTAITELQRRKKDGEIPDRLLARQALVALGRIALAEDDASAGTLVKSLQEACAAFEQRWEDAVNSEVSLAVNEHVQGVDPHYLDTPEYDFAYTIAARERLEARLRAVDLLGHAVDESLLDQIADADALLAPYLDGTRPGYHPDPSQEMGQDSQ